MTLALDNFVLRARAFALRALRRPGVDVPLACGLLLLAGIGLTTVYSATDLDGHFVLRQGLAFVLGAVLLLGIGRVPPQSLRNWTPWLYAGSLVLLLAVAAFGTGRGTHRWLDLKILRFQPSEICKLTVPMMAAWVLNLRELPPRLTTLAMVGALIALPAALIARQPDLGTALLVAMSGLFAVFLAGMAWWGIALILGGGAVAAPLAWHFLHEYQRDRLRILFDPDADPLGKGYHIIQSKIAVGSGGLWGKGWHHATQSRLDFLPEHHTDFIFAVFAEEWGLIGACALIALYLFIVGRCLVIATQARDTYSRLLAGSIGMAFFVYVMVNGGMVCGILPVVGVPLPLISYGGSAVVSMLAGFGVLMSIHNHRGRLRR